MVIKSCIALALLCCPLLAHAIELGEPQVGSWLGEPVQVLVPVELGGLEPQRVQIRLLNANEYSALNLAPAPAFLSHLSATWSDTSDGLNIKLTSARTNPEPLLSIAVELATSRLRIVRYVSLLFDPRPASATPPKRPNPRHTAPRQPAEAPTPTRPSPAAKVTPKPAVSAHSLARTTPSRVQTAKPVLQRFQFSHALREIPPPTAVQQVLRTPHGTLSAQLAYSAGAADAAPQPKLPLTNKGSQTTHGTDRAQSANPSPPVTQPKPQTPAPEPEIGDHSEPVAVVGLSLTRLLVSTLPVLLSISLWWLLRRRIQIGSQDEETELTAERGRTKVTAIHSGRLAADSSTPRLRAANE